MILHRAIFQSRYFRIAGLLSQIYMGLGFLGIVPGFKTGNPWVSYPLGILLTLSATLILFGVGEKKSQR